MQVQVQVQVRVQIQECSTPFTDTSMQQHHQETAPYLHLSPFVYVPSLERQTTRRAVALCTSRQVPVEDSTELVLLVFYQAESRGKRVNSTYNSMLMQSHCQCTLPVRTAKFTCNSMLMQSHTANSQYQCGQPRYAGSPKFSWPRFQLLLKILESESKVHSHVKL